MAIHTLHKRKSKTALEVTFSAFCFICFSFFCFFFWGGGGGGGGGGGEVGVGDLPDL